MAKPAPPAKQAPPPVEPPDQVSLEKLVQQLIDARANYAEGLHRLYDYYKARGQSVHQGWVRREQRDYNRISKYKYFRNIKAHLRAVDPKESSETDIVESLVADRQIYRQSLETLVVLFHQAKDVGRWIKAKRELKGLISANQYLYLRDADTPGHELKPSDRIKAADELLLLGRELKKEAGPSGVIRYKNQLALETFRRLISDYPSSDKIDDAAFELGEIYYRNLRDYRRAIRWYECVLAWDPNTQLPANYRIAKIYDKKLGNLLTALNYYLRAQQTAAHDSAERRDIESRIRKLSGK